MRKVIGSEKGRKILFHFQYQIQILLLQVGLGRLIQTAGGMSIQTEAMLWAGLR